MTDILEARCASNKYIFLETVLGVKKIKVGGYIARERNFFLFFVARFVYLFKI